MPDPIPVLLLAAAGWLALSVAAGMLLGPVAGWLKRRGVALAVEDPTCTEEWRDEVGCDSAVAHRCTRTGEHTTHSCPCGALVIDPQPTYGQERIYAATGLVQVGLAMVHRRCADARRDFATDKICPECGPKFARVSA